MARFEGGGKLACRLPANIKNYVQTIVSVLQAGPVRVILPARRIHEPIIVG